MSFFFGYKKVFASLFLLKTERTKNKQSSKVRKMSDDGVSFANETRVWSLSVHDGRIVPKLVFSPDRLGTLGRDPRVLMREALRFKEEEDASAPYSYFFNSPARIGRVKITVKRPRAAVPQTLVHNLECLLSMARHGNDFGCLVYCRPLNGTLVLNTGFLRAKIRFEGVPISWPLHRISSHLGAKIVPDATFDKPLPQARYTRENLSHWCDILADIEDVLRKDDFSPEFVQPALCSSQVREKNKKLAELFLNDVRLESKYRLNLCGHAARHGSLFALAFGSQQGFMLSEKEATWAAEFGQAKTLRFCLEALGTPTKVDTCKRAAAAGSIECLEILRSHDPPAPWNTEVCAAAAQNGHLDTLKWLRSTEREDKCSWDERSRNLDPVTQAKLSQFKKMVREHDAAEQLGNKRNKTEGASPLKPPKLLRKVKSEPGVEEAEPPRDHVRKAVLRMKSAFYDVPVPADIDNPRFFTNSVEFNSDFSPDQLRCFQGAMQEEKMIYDRAKDKDKKSYDEAWEKYKQSRKHRIDGTIKRGLKLVQALSMTPKPTDESSDITVSERSAVKKWMTEISQETYTPVSAQTPISITCVGWHSVGSEKTLYRISDDKASYYELIKKYARNESKNLTKWLNRNKRVLVFLT